MALFDLKNIKKNMQKSADELIKTVTDAAESLPDSVKNMKATDTAKVAAYKGFSTVESLISKGGEVVGDQLEKIVKTDDAVKSALEQDAVGERTIPVKNALKLIYCLMAVDGTISPEEEEQLMEIGSRLDPSFETYKNEIIDNEISVKNAVMMDEEEYFDFIHDHAAAIIYKSENTGEGIGVKTLVWDLLVMAFSEGDYSPNEKRLIRFISRALKIDLAVPLEMEQTLRTITALNKEEEWLKSTTRSYSVIEEQINEVKKRRETIITGVHALMAD